ncbi:MAG: hypothetical protein ABI766_03705 [Gemmatimonadales bacterium]
MPDPTLIVAGALGFLSLVFWFAYVRPAPTETASGVIIAKTYRPATTYMQSHGTRVSTRIPISEAYLFAVRIDGFSESAQLSLNTIASAGFEVGQGVRVEFERRGIPPLPRRVRLMDMQHDERGAVR